MDKITLKSKVNKKISELIDAVEKIGDINYFEIEIKHVNGDLIIKLENTYKDKVK